MPPFYARGAFIPNPGNKPLNLEAVKGMGHIVRTVLGVGLLALGVLGSLLPVVPGIVFFAAGIAILGTDHVIVRRFHPLVQRGRSWLERWGILKAREP